MSEDGGFIETWDRDAEGTVRIKSTCKRCGEFQLVNIRDGSLAEWESNHVCRDSAEEP